MEYVGLLIGGVLPAFLFGFSNTCNKLATQNKIGVGPFLILFGLATLLVGMISFFLFPEIVFVWKGASLAFMLGVLQMAATAGIIIALNSYKVPNGKLVPLFNMNTLVAVLLALWIFSEYKEVEVVELLIGSLCIVIGGTLVARA